MKTIVVTAEDISHGQRGDCGGCPVARAINRALRPGYQVDVTVDEVEVMSCGVMVRRVHARCLPAAARAFTRAFDAHGPASVARFEFDLDLPWEFFAPRGMGVRA